MLMPIFSGQQHASSIWLQIAQFCLLDGSAAFPGWFSTHPASNCVVAVATSVASILITVLSQNNIMVPSEFQLTYSMLQLAVCLLLVGHTILSVDNQVRNSGRSMSLFRWIYETMFAQNPTAIAPPEMPDAPV